jgi:hypothetical protein
MTKKKTNAEPGDPIDYALLAKPFDPMEIEWRVGQAAKTGQSCTLLAYLTSRAVMDRLDEVLGPDGWQDSYEAGPDGGLMCGIGVRTNGDNWVWKYDGAENTQIEAIKGGYSGAFKRAAVKWGIGRYLYKLGMEWHETVDHYTAKEPGVDYIKVKVGQKWAWVKRPSLPLWAMPPLPKDDEWEDERKAFCAELNAGGFNYDDVADWCDALGRPRPSQMGSEGRSRLLNYLNTEDGLRAFSSWRN